MTLAARSVVRTEEKSEMCIKSWTPSWKRPEMHARRISIASRFSSQPAVIPSRDCVNNVTFQRNFFLHFRARLFTVENLSAASRNSKTFWDKYAKKKHEMKRRKNQQTPQWAALQCLEQTCVPYLEASSYKKSSSLLSYNKKMYFKRNLLHF